MKLTVSQAARAAGKSKSQISRRVKKGDIAAEKGADGRPLIDLSDLQRVYPHADPAKRGIQRPSTKPRNEAETRTLRTQVDMLRDDRDRLRTELGAERRERRDKEEHARQERDRLLGLLETAQRQLTDQRPPAAERRGFWKRVFG